ncbi:MAG: amidohydrolase family protein [Spirochaetota bacterium]
MKVKRTIFDAHVHIFKPGIIDNVANRPEIGKALNLDMEHAHEKLGVDTLENAMKSANVEACLALPTASAAKVKKENDTFIAISENSDYIYTACTLHPDYAGKKEEIERFKNKGIKVIKLCSFSQGFVLNGQKAMEMFDLISSENINNKAGFSVLLDTFFDADRFFGTKPIYNTKPALFADLVKNFPQINFIGAHMAGLHAPYTEVRKHLLPAENFFMDTSNGAHTLQEADFIECLKLHGPEHIIFGTDWPWFGYDGEIELVEHMLDRAGYSEIQKDSVFRGNIVKTLGIK